MPDHADVSWAAGDGRRPVAATSDDLHESSPG